MPGFVHALALIAHMASGSAGGSAGGGTDQTYFPDLDLPEQLGPAKDVIQKRKYELASEFALNLGLLPADPYYKGYTVGVSYAYHFSHAFAWDVLQVGYSFNTNTHLRDEVRRHVQAAQQKPPHFRKIEFYATSRLVFKPLYGKEALFNTEVVHLEGYLMVGPGAARLSAPTTGTPKDMQHPIVFGGDIGFGLRLWFARAFSARLECGEFIYMYDNKPVLAMHLQLVLSANLRGED